MCYAKVREPSLHLSECVKWINELAMLGFRNDACQYCCAWKIQKFAITLNHQRVSRVTDVLSTSVFIRSSLPQGQMNFVGDCSASSLLSSCVPIIYHLLHASSAPSQGVALCSARCQCQHTAHMWSPVCHPPSPLEWNPMHTCSLIHRHFITQVTMAELGIQ